MGNGVPGTSGYAEDAARLIERYEALSFETVHEAILHLFPQPPALVLDVGAGTGRDAAFLAGRGHHVVAVEPADALRNWARQAHGDRDIEWLDDALPTLDRLRDRRNHFDLILMTAVWMHLDAEERQCAMPVLARLLRPNGLLAMSLRHGSVPANRVMHDVSAGETIDLAAGAGLVLDHHTLSRSAGAGNRSAGVTWTHLAFRRPT